MDRPLVAISDENLAMEALRAWRLGEPARKDFFWKMLGEIIELRPEITDLLRTEKRCANCERQGERDSVAGESAATGICGHFEAEAAARAGDNGRNAITH